ncbi:MAG: hypothetical protein ACK2T6_06935, partial [Anaerolineae bacterium]
TDEQGTQSNSVDIELDSFVFDPLTIRRLMLPGGSHTVELKRIVGVTASTYSAVIHGGGNIAAVARTNWEGGGAAAYLAPEVGAELVLPLAMRDVYTHSTLIQVVNTDPYGDNSVFMRSYMANGAVRNEWEYVLWPGETGRIDPSYEAEFADLSMEALWFSADAPLSVMALGDEYNGRGVSSLRARPPSAGSERQWLPFVRANMGGDTLIAVANVQTAPVEATISYRGAPGSPSGAGRLFEQDVRIGPRSAVFIDLDVIKRRGNVEPPGLPRGARNGSGFFGSAEIVGDGPLLAAAWEQETTQVITDIVASAAYNAFGPADLSATFAVPRVSYAVGGQTSQLVLQNPGEGAVEVSIDLVLPDGSTIGLPAETLGAGEMTVVPVALPAPGVGQALIEATEPIAVLVYDIGRDVDRTAYWAVKMPPELIDLPERTPPPTPLPATATSTPGDGTDAPTPGTGTPSATPPLDAPPAYLPMSWNPRR